MPPEGVVFRAGAANSGGPSTRALKAAVAGVGVGLALGIGCGFGALGTAGEVGAAELLPAERAFAYSARALDPATVEVRFAIAPGYYLYRDRLQFAVVPGQLAEAPRLPPGKVKDDPFFGRVETYRDDVALRLKLAAAAPGTALTVTAESQGCADAGVCYPAQRQSLAVTLPAVGAGPGPVVEFAPAPKRWFQ